MPLRECIETHTNLELEAWMIWLSNHWEERSLTDYYLQQVAYEVRLSNSRFAGRTVRMEDLELKFTKKSKAEPTEVQVAQATGIAKAKWFLKTGYKRKKT